MSAPGRANRVHGKPFGTQYAMIQWPVRLWLGYGSAESETDEGRPTAEARQPVDTDQRRGGEDVGRLFERLAAHGLHQRFARLEVSCRLVETHTLVGLLFDQKELAATLDDRGDDHMRLPDIVHGIQKTKKAGFPLPSAGLVERLLLVFLGGLFLAVFRLLFLLIFLFVRGESN